MASFHVEGLSDLLNDFNDVINLPDDVVSEMLNVEADVVVASQKSHAASMLQGPYYEGSVASSIKKSKVYKANGVRSVKIEFNGLQHGTRISEIAFVNEFGKERQPARPFIQTANESCADEAVAAASTVYDEYLKTKGL